MNVPRDEMDAMVYDAVGTTLHEETAHDLFVRLTTVFVDAFGLTPFEAKNEVKRSFWSLLDQGWITAGPCWEVKRRNPVDNFRRFKAPWD